MVSTANSELSRIEFLVMDQNGMYLVASARLAKRR